MGITPEGSRSPGMPKGWGDGKFSSDLKTFLPHSGLPGRPPGSYPPVLNRHGDGGNPPTEKFFILNLPQGSNLAHLWEGDGGRGRLALAKVMNQATVLV